MSLVESAESWLRQTFTWSNSWPTWRERLVGLGYREIVTTPHVAEERDALFRPAGVSPARLANPLSEEAGVLKSTGIVTMAAALEWNLNHGQRNARLFEIGRHYRLEGNQSIETSVLTIGGTGEAREKGLYDSGREFSFADLKGDLDAVGELAGGLCWSADSSRDGAHAAPTWLHAARRAQVSLDLAPTGGQDSFFDRQGGAAFLGEAGELARRVADRLKLRQAIFLAELGLDPLYAAIEALKNSRRYQPLPRFPAVERDFSLLLADGITFAQISESIRSLGIPEIGAIEAVDLFRGKNVPAGKYSLLIRVTFQSREATLMDAQVNHFAGKIISILEHRHGAQLRAS